MKSDVTLPQLLGGVVVLATLVFVGYWIAGIVGALVVVGLFALSIVVPLFLNKWGMKAVARAIQNLEATPSEKDVSSQMSDEKE